MISIKAYAVPKGSNNTVSSGGGTTVVANEALSDRWFYYNDDYNAVCCRYNFYSVGSVTANGAPPEEDVQRDDIVDNLTSTDATKALSANMGRVLKNLIDSITTTGGGQAVITVDWSNVTNKPSTYTPASHTHSTNDITGLSTTISTQNSNISTMQGNLTSHTGNQNIHLTAEQKNKLDALTPAQIAKLGDFLDMITVNTQSATITVNGSINTINDVTAHTS